jgi:putative ABC transport system ATP-binding protein
MISIDTETAERKILKLSGEEQQRIGIARPYSHIPDIIIANEPAGNLDWETAADILKFLTSLVHDEGKYVITVSHS